jgi:precorrin-4/cobalt-precorrin-4 C11-methyltransferase
VILDYGDPTLFGPQACNLREFAELNPIIVPGVSCLNAGSAMLGMSVVGGGLGYGDLTLTKAPWASDEDPFSYEDPDHGLVLFTMKSDFSYTLQRLLEQFPSETPIAVVMSAGFEEQGRVVQATLSTVEQQMEGLDLPFEYLIYVGNFLNHRLS